jgi:sulfur carrier protein
LELEPRGIAVAVDGEVVTRRTWGERPLAAGERVEILSIAQGG